MRVTESQLRKTVRKMVNENMSFSSDYAYGKLKDDFTMSVRDFFDHMLEVGFSAEVARDKIEEELAMELDSAVSGSKKYGPRKWR
jgi:hypothetical protein